MKKNLIISSGIVFIMLILSTLTLFTHTIKTPAFVIGIFKSALYHCLRSISNYSVYIV